MKHLIYDIECYRNLFHLVTRNIQTNEYQHYELNDILLTNIIFNPDITLIGWNNHSYDDMLLNYIAQQSIPAESGWAAQVVAPITKHSVWELSTRIIQAPKGDTDAYLKQLRYADKVYQSIDIKALLDPLPGLKKMELRTGFHNVQDLPVDPSKKLNKQQREIVRKYCINDVDATYRIYTDHALTHIQLREFLALKFGLPVNQLRSASEPRTAETILTKQATQYTRKKAWRIKEELPPVEHVHINNCIPRWIKFTTPNLTHQLHELKKLTLPVNPLTGYAIGTELKRIIKIGNKNYQLGIGGLHSIDEPGTWHVTQDTQLIDADVTSYYPSILLRDNLYPRGYDVQWSFAYDLIYHDRLAAKSDTHRQIEAHALKIILNSTFGKFGSKFSSFYDPTLLLRVTITGQLALLMLIEMCDHAKIEVLSANTDGIVIKLHTDQQNKWDTLYKQWEKMTYMHLEYTPYRRYSRRDVNSYTALTIDNKIKNKGVFNPPDIRHDTQAPIIQKLARATLLYDISPQEYLDTNQDELTIHDFIFHFGATRAFDVFLRANEIDTPLSKTNRWYASNQTTENQLIKIGGKNGSTIKIPNGENIQLCNTLTNDDIPHDIDFEYYLNKAIKLIEVCS